MQTDEVMAKETWEALRARYLNLGTPWGQLRDDQRAYLIEVVRRMRELGMLPTDLRAYAAATSAAVTVSA